MTHLEEQIQMLKASTVEMWHLVISQLSKSQAAVKDFDKSIVHNIQVNEKMVDTYELKIDKDCENIIALFNPVAIDLRFVLAVLKINYNLERIGDYAYGISKLLDDMDSPFSDELLKSCRISEMFDISIELLIETLISFENENKQLTKTIIGKEKPHNKINKDAIEKIAEYKNNTPGEIKMTMKTLAIILKLERVIDHIQNIAEEMIFHMEARVLKHDKKGKKEISR
ncbi:MAG: phosphate signaling complex protein PhoU [Bacteroidia bacterium]|nr:phosphate signaling complex protein PhoU [Bacteroidia bacterium]